MFFSNSEQFLNQGMSVGSGDYKESLNNFSFQKNWI